MSWICSSIFAYVQIDAFIAKFWKVARGFLFSPSPLVGEDASALRASG